MNPTLTPQQLMEVRNVTKNPDGSISFQAGGNDAVYTVPGTDPLAIEVLEAHRLAMELKQQQTPAAPASAASEPPELAAETAEKQGGFFGWLRRAWQKVVTFVSKPFRRKQAATATMSDDNVWVRKAEQRARELQGGQEPSPAAPSPAPALNQAPVVAPAPAAPERAPVAKGREHPAASVQTNSTPAPASQEPAPAAPKPAADVLFQGITFVGEDIRITYADGTQLTMPPSSPMHARFAKLMKRAEELTAKMDERQREVLKEMERRGAALESVLPPKTIEGQLERAPDSPSGSPRFMVVTEEGERRALNLSTPELEALAKEPKLGRVTILVSEYSPPKLDSLLLPGQDQPVTFKDFMAKQAPGYEGVKIEDPENPEAREAEELARMNREAEMAALSAQDEEPTPEEIAASQPLAEVLAPAAPAPATTKGEVAAPAAEPAPAPVPAEVAPTPAAVEPEVNAVVPASDKSEPAPAAVPAETPAPAASAPEAAPVEVPDAPEESAAERDPNPSEDELKEHEARVREMAEALAPDTEAPAPAPAAAAQETPEELQPPVKPRRRYFPAYEQDPAVPPMV